MTEFITAERFSLFRDYYDELLSYLTLKLRSRDRAMDVVQETYLRILSHEQSHPIHQPRAFLYRIALNLTIDLFRKQQRHAEESLDSEEIQRVLTVPADQETAVESREQIRLLYRAISELPPRCREVFLLHKFKERSHAEIAAHLGISKNMVEKHVIKALAHCRRRLEGML